MLHRIAAHIPHDLLIKIATAVMPLFVMAGCPLHKDGTIAGPSRAEVRDEAPADEPLGETIDCGLEGAAPGPDCRLEKRGQEWLVFRPDGEFHRLAAANGRVWGVDGADRGAYRRLDGRIEWRIDNEVYSLPEGDLSR